MTCSKCGKKRALVQITVDADGTTRTYFFCELCAKEFGFVPPLDSPKFPLDKILDALSDYEPGEPIEEENLPIEVEMKPGLKCHHCGLTFDEFMHTGRCGCSTCYEDFKPNIEAIIESIHGTTQHVGKERETDDAVMEPYVQKNRLEAELREAIATEDYEKAADIRDQMKDLA